MQKAESSVDILEFGRYVKVWRYYSMRRETFASMLPERTREEVAQKNNPDFVQQLWDQLTDVADADGLIELDQGKDSFLCLDEPDSDMKDIIHAEAHDAWDHVNGEGSPASVAKETAKG